MKVVLMAAKRVVLMAAKMVYLKASRRETRRVHLMVASTVASTVC